MKRTWKQRALSICMTICLLIGMLPMTTFATDDVKTQSSEETEAEITYFR